MKWALALCVLLVAPAAHAQVTDTTVDGIRVLVDHVPGAELVVIDLYARGGARRWSAADAGIEELSLAVAREGTTVGNESVGVRLARLRSRLGSVSSIDYGRLRGRGLVASFAPLFDLVADSFLAPAVKPNAVVDARARQLREIGQRGTQPERVAWELMRGALFPGQPFANSPFGTAATVTALTREAVLAHLASLRTKSALLVVVVGDVTAAEVTAKVHARLAGLPMGTPMAPLPPPPSSPTALRADDRALPTNYLLAATAGPRWGDPDFVAGLIAMHVLDRRLFDEVRSKRGLSYAPHAQMRASTEQPVCEMSVSAVNPLAAYRVMLAEVDRLTQTPLDADELAGYEALYLTHFWTQQQATNERAEALAAGQLFGGDWRLGRDLPAAVARLTPADIQRFARRYLHHWQFAFVGNSALVKNEIPTKR